MDVQTPSESPLLPPLPQSPRSSPTSSSVLSTAHSSPSNAAIIVHEVPFRGSQAILSYYPQDRVAVFKQRYHGFVFVIDTGLRQSLQRLTMLDNKDWHYEGDRRIYRLADLVYLLQCLCRETDPPEEQYLGDLAILSKALEDEVDRMSTPTVQIELSISREIGSGPNDSLMYFYWCHIVLYLRENKTVLVRVNSEGRVCPFGEPKSARIHNAKQSGSGLVLCVGWHWGADVVQIWNAEHLNSYGIYFLDPRIQHSLLLRGWSATRFPLATPRTVGELIKWR